MNIKIVETDNRVDEYDYDYFIDILCEEFLKWKDKEKSQEEE